MIVELPHHKGGLGITPLQASGMAAFYSATAELVAWLHSLPHASEWAAGQNLADPDTWNSSALQTLKQLHDKLLMHHSCTEWAPPPDADAHVPDAPAQERDDDNARPLSLPPLNLLASLRGRQDVENGSSSCSPVATSATSGHTAHQGRAHDPPNERMRDVHKLHHIQSVPTDLILRRPARRFFRTGRALCARPVVGASNAGMRASELLPVFEDSLDERSALRGNMPQRNDEEGGKQPRLSFSPAASVWGQMGRAWTTTAAMRRAPRRHQYHGERPCCLLPSVLRARQQPCPRSFRNVPCRCKRYFKKRYFKKRHLGEVLGW